MLNICREGMNLAALVRSKAAKYIQQLELLPEQQTQPSSTNDGWAFGDTPSLSTLLQRQHRYRHSGPLPDYQDALRSSSSLHAPSALGVMAEALGVAASAESMAGTLLLDLPHADELSKQRSSIKDTVDLAWSNEALGRGVAEAKAGRYEDAHRWYAKALELFDRNVDALVARGAAFANEHLFCEAEADLQAAVELDPANANAAKYLQTVREYRGKKEQEQQQQEQQQEQEQEQQQQQQQGAQGDGVQQQGAGHAADAGAPADVAQGQQQAEGGAAGAAGREPAQQEAPAAAERGRARAASASTPGSSSRSHSRSSSSSRSRSSGSASPPAKLSKPSAADIKEAIRQLAKHKHKKAKKKSKSKSKHSRRHKQKHKHR